MAAKNKENEIHITRIYDAPVKMVWDAWVDPKQVAQWWGPRGFTLTSHSKDVRPGGTWKYTMHGPDGVDYPNLTTFHEVEKYSRLVYDHGATENTPPLFRVTVDFAEQNGKTKMEMRMALDTPEAARETKKFIKKAGGNSTWDRLAEFLSSTDKFVINRSFEAPVETVFDMWINPKHFSQWLAPRGFTMDCLNSEIKPGGKLFYRMNGPGDVTMYGIIAYKEITKPTHLLYTQVFSDENQKITRHPMSPTWPETMLTDITFTAEGENATRITIEWQVYGDATKEERDTFHHAKGGMTQGWTGSFDKLEEYIEESKKS